MAGAPVLGRAADTPYPVMNKINVIGVPHFPTPGCPTRVGGGPGRVWRIKPSSATPLSGPDRAAAEMGGRLGARGPARCGVTEDPFSAQVCRLRVGTLDAVQAEPGGPHAVNRRSACLRWRGPPATRPGAAPHASAARRPRKRERSLGRFRLF